MTINNKALDEVQELLQGVNTTESEFREGVAEDVAAQLNTATETLKEGRVVALSGDILANTAPPMGMPDTRAHLSYIDEANDTTQVNTDYAITTAIADNVVRSNELDVYTETLTATGTFTFPDRGTSDYPLVGLAMFNAAAGTITIDSGHPTVYHRERD